MSDTPDLPEDADEDVDEVVEMVEVDRQELTEVLAGLLARMHPYDNYDAFMRGMELLLGIDEDAAVSALGFLYDLDDGDKVVAGLADFWGIDLAEVPNHSLCAGGCGDNVSRICEVAYMTTAEVWAAAGNPVGYYCVACLERLLGRRLVRDDFNWDVPMTSGDDFDRSERLTERMAR